MNKKLLTLYGLKAGRPHGIRSPRSYLSRLCMLVPSWRASVGELSKG